MKYLFNFNERYDFETGSDKEMVGIGHLNLYEDIQTFIMNHKLKSNTLSYNITEYIINMGFDIEEVSKLILRDKELVSSLELDFRKRKMLKFDKEPNNKLF